MRDFGASWRDGVAFLALIDAIKANLFNLADMRKASTTNRQRLETAFDVAENKLGIARLLDAEDVDVEKPDEKSIMTYVAQFLHKYPEPKVSIQVHSVNKLEVVEKPQLDIALSLSLPLSLPLSLLRSLTGKCTRWCDNIARRIL